MSTRQRSRKRKLSPTKKLSNPTPLKKQRVTRSSTAKKSKSTTTTSRKYKTPALQTKTKKKSKTTKSKKQKSTKKTTNNQQETVWNWNEAFEELDLSHAPTTAIFQNVRIKFDNEFKMGVNGDRKTPKYNILTAEAVMTAINNKLSRIQIRHITEAYPSNCDEDRIKKSFKFYEHVKDNQKFWNKWITLNASITQELKNWIENKKFKHQKVTANSNSDNNNNSNNNNNNINNINEVYNINNDIQEIILKWATNPHVSESEAIMALTRSNAKLRKQINELHTIFGTNIMEQNESTIREQKLFINKLQTRTKDLQINITNLHSEYKSKLLEIKDELRQEKQKYKYNVEKKNEMKSKAINAPKRPYETLTRTGKINRNRTNNEILQNNLQGNQFENIIKRNKETAESIIIPSFVKTQNKEIKGNEKDPKKVNKVALTGYKKSVTHNVRHDLRMIQSHKMGDHGRSIRDTTSGGIYLGGGYVTGYQQDKALRMIEKKKYDQNRQFAPIDKNTLKKIPDFNRLKSINSNVYKNDNKEEEEVEPINSNNNSNDNKEEEIEQINSNNDARRGKKGNSAKLKLFGVVIDDFDNEFDYILKLIVNDIKFKEHDYNRHNEFIKSQIAATDGTTLPEQTQRHAIVWDAAGINGNCESESRTTGTLKPVGFGEGLDGSPVVLHRLWQFFCGDQSYDGKKCVKDELLNHIFTNIHNTTKMIPIQDTNKILPLKNIFACSGDLKAIKIFKNDHGPGGNICQTDTVFNVDGKIAFIDRKTEHWKDINIPHAIDIRGDRPQKFRDFIINIPEYKEQVLEHVQYLNDEVGQLPFPNLKPTHEKNIKIHKKRQALAAHAKTIKKFGTKLAILYRPTFYIYNDWLMDALHHNKQGGCHIPDYVGKKLCIGWKSPQDLLEICFNELLQDSRINSAFCVQYFASFATKKFQTNMTCRIMSNVLRQYFHMIQKIIEYYELDVSRPAIAKLKVMVSVLKFTYRHMKLRSMNNKLVWPGGVNGAMFKEYDKLSYDQYSHIKQVLNDFNIPYYHIHFHVLRNKLKRCLEMDTTRNYSVALGSTSAHEHTQGQDKRLNLRSANFDADEILKQSNLHSCAFGYDSITYLDINLTELRAKNIKAVHSKFTDEDEADYQSIIESLPPVARGLYKKIDEHDWHKTFKW